MLSSHIVELYEFVNVYGRLVFAECFSQLTLQCNIILPGFHHHIWSSIPSPQTAAVYVQDKFNTILTIMNIQIYQCLGSRTLIPPRDNNPINRYLSLNGENKTLEHEPSVRVFSKLTRPNSILLQTVQFTIMSL